MRPTIAFFICLSGCVELEQPRTEAEERAALDLVNQADQIEMIDAFGLDPGTADRLVARKLGADGQPATLDDAPFRSLAELDLDAAQIDGIVAQAIEMDPVDLDDLDTAAATCWAYRDPEKEFFRLVNRARANNGKAPLERDAQLSRVARHWAKHMASADHLAHNPNLAHQVTHWSWLGENVGVAPPGAWQDQVKSLHQAFMSSSAHRANILSNAADYQGVGIKIDGDGFMWVTEIFSGGNNPGTTLEMPSC